MNKRIDIGGKIDIDIEQMMITSGRDINIVTTENIDIDHEVHGSGYRIKTDILIEDATKTGNLNPKEVDGEIIKIEMTVLDETITRTAAIPNGIHTTEIAGIENEVHTTENAPIVNKVRTIEIVDVMHFGKSIISMHSILRKKRILSVTHLIFQLKLSFQLLHTTISPSLPRIS